MKLISTSALAKERNLDPKELFNQLTSKGWIYKKEDQWHLTKEGRIVGGEMLNNPKFGDYVAWPVNLNIEQNISSKNTINATQMGEHFKISSRKVNLYLSEVGWIEKDRGGWAITKEGKKNGGHPMEAQNGKPYSIWDDSILNSAFLLRATASTFDKGIKVAVVPSGFKSCSA